MERGRTGGSRIDPQFRTVSSASAEPRAAVLCAVCLPSLNQLLVLLSVTLNQQQLLLTYCVLPLARASGSLGVFSFVLYIITSFVPSQTAQRRGAGWLSSGRKKQPVRGVLLYRGVVHCSGSEVARVDLLRAQRIWPCSSV